MKFSARFILIFVIFTICYLMFNISPVSAQTNPYAVPNTNPDVPKNLHTWTQNVMIEVMSAMACQLTGIDPTSPKTQCLGVDSKTGKIGYVQGGGGAIGVASHMIAMLYTPPLHTTDYFRYLAHNFGIAKPAYAAGFEGLKPIQSLWIAFRNIVYLLFVLVFVVIGLAIMFRVRIDPRTVMTIQNQIPKIIIGILLVTFSFAIAGFLIDLMYVAIFLSYELISGAAAKAIPPIDLSGLNPLSLQNKTPFEAAGQVGNFGLGSYLGLFHIAFVASKSIFYIIHDLFGGVIKDLLSDVGGGLLGKIPWIGGFLSGIVGGILGKVIGVVIGDVVGGAIGFIAFFIIAIALIISLFRLWFTLLIAYALILLDVVFAPFWIVAALLPGTSVGFGAWIRSIIGNLAAFPAVIVMFLLAKAFIEGFGTKPAPTDFVPPLIGDISGTDTIGSLIGLGIILMTPNVVGIVKSALGAPKVGVGPMIIGGLAGGFGAPGGILATSGHLGSTLFGLSHFPGANKIPFLNKIAGGYQQPQQQRP